MVAANVDGLDRRPCGACQVNHKACLNDCPFAWGFPNGDEGQREFRSLKNVYGLAYVRNKLKPVPAERKRKVALSLLSSLTFSGGEDMNKLLKYIRRLQRAIVKDMPDTSMLKRQLLLYNPSSMPVRELHQSLQETIQMKQQQASPPPARHQRASPPQERHQRATPTQERQ